MKHKYFVVYSSKEKRVNAVVDRETKILNYDDVTKLTEVLKVEDCLSHVFIENLVYLGVE